MQQDSTTFWADIKDYEERLAQNPESYLFSRLSDVYLKVNLIDDAVYTARKGVEKHPTYLAGLRALAMACYAKGLHAESRQSLEIVAAALPEDIEVQKLLGKMQVSNNNLDAARETYRTALEFYPADEELRDEYQALQQELSVDVEDDSPPSEVATIPGSVLDETFSDIPEEVEEIIELQESDIVEEDESDAVVAVEHHDPLSTATLAELYVQQHFIVKALEIYRAILADDPDNGAVRSRISELEAIEAASSVDFADENSVEESQPTAAFQSVELQSPAISAQGEADNVVATLEGWLDNIRRIKACR